MRSMVSRLIFSVLWIPVYASAQIVPPRSGVELPQAYFDRVAEDKTAFQFRNAWIQKTHRAKIAREEFFARPRPEGMTWASLPGALRNEFQVTGTIRVPMILIKYSNTGADPFPVSQVQNQIFDGPTTSAGTLTQLYSEMSYGALTMTGDVLGWVTGSGTDTFYEGGGACNGLCGTAKTGLLILEALQGVDGSVDFGLYDNDGPDGIANSGDDDGFVDFIAIVHPETGGECGGPNMWSHRWVVSGWPEFAGPWVSNDARAGGGNIMILDYTIQPVKGSVSGCGPGINEIGVFSHEFGHAFGLPDLYDTDGGGQGIGEHGLMGSGNWRLPPNPTHMCAWSKVELGWLSPTAVNGVTQSYAIGYVEANPVVYQLNMIEEKFSRKAFQPLSGTASLHCGSPTFAANNRNWAGGSGYGNGWRERIQHTFSWDGTPVTLQFDASYDTEATYDFGRVIIDVGGTETMLAQYTGVGSVAGASIDLTPPLTGSGQTAYTIILELTSDVSFSDEDGNYNSGSGGPFKVDNVSVTGGGESYSSDFEQDEAGWFYDFNATPNREYFLVENRNKAGQFDKNIFAEGLYIWHIEQSVAHSVFGNTGGTAGTASLKPAGVQLRSADGLNHLLLGVNRGDAGDVYPGSSNNTTFDDTTNPNSKSHSLFMTNVLVNTISAPAQQMSANMRAGYSPPTIASIDPVTGESNSTVQINEVAGTFMVHGATFLLRSAAAIDYPASNVNWVSKKKIAGDLDLTVVPPGFYDVVVRIPDGQEAVLAAGFEVTNPVPVFIQAFDALVRGGRIELSWSLYADEEIRGFNILRREAGSTVEIRVNPTTIESDARSYTDTDAEPGKQYTYVLLVVLANGTELPSQRIDARTNPYPLVLFQNYPNPFNPSTRIQFSLPQRSYVNLTVYDAKGRRVIDLVSQERPAGLNEVVWNGKNGNGARVSSGVYFYRLRAGQTVLTRKMLLLK